MKVRPALVLLFSLVSVAGIASLIRGLKRPNQQSRKLTGEDRHCGINLSDETLIAFGLDPLEMQAFCEYENESRADPHHYRSEDCMSSSEVPPQADTSVCTDRGHCLPGQECWLIQGNPPFTDCATVEELQQNYGITPLQAFCIVDDEIIPFP